jgi:hypothetical protein
MASVPAFDLTASRNDSEPRNKAIRNPTATKQTLFPGRVIGMSTQNTKLTIQTCVH